MPNCVNGNDLQQQNNKEMLNHDAVDRKKRWQLVALISEGMHYPRRNKPPSLKTPIPLAHLKRCLQAELDEHLGYEKKHSVGWQTIRVTHATDITLPRLSKASGAKLRFQFPETVMVHFEPKSN
jgi:hypothetical protein